MVFDSPGRVSHTRWEFSRAFPISSTSCTSIILATPTLIGAEVRRLFLKKGRGLMLSSPSRNLPLLGQRLFHWPYHARTTDVPLCTASSGGIDFDHPNSMAVERPCLRRGCHRDVSGQGQNGDSHPIPKAGVGGSPRFAGHTQVDADSRSTSPGTE